MTRQEARAEFTGRAYPDDGGRRHTARYERCACCGNLIYVRHLVRGVDGEQRCTTCHRTRPDVFGYNNAA